MKNIFCILAAAVLLFSCDKNALQQTTDNLNKADSLFTKANNGIKTLDSITKAITDSDGIAKKVIPEIQKQTKILDSTLKSGGFEMDSINNEIEKITKNVKVKPEVLKSLDSANASLKKGENAIAVLTRTADKILNAAKNKRTTAEEKPTETFENEKQKAEENAAGQKSVAEKKATLEIEVQDLDEAKRRLKAIIEEHNGTLYSENFTQTEGILREDFRLKFPFSEFDSFVESASGELGILTRKNVEIYEEGYNMGNKAEVSISLIQNEILAANAFNKDKTEVNDGNNAEPSTFFETVKKAGTSLLPFWPLILIAGLLLYLLFRYTRKKEKQTAAVQQTSEASSVQKEPLLPTAQVRKEENQEEDYSRFLPKK